jgi:acyl-CoA dehydrogenase
MGGLGDVIIFDGHRDDMHRLHRRTHDRDALIRMRRTIFTADHDLFRDSVRTFIEREAVPNGDRWEAEGMVDREFWRRAAAAGFVGFEVPEEFGGVGVRDFRYNAIINEEMMYAAAVGDGFSMANDILTPYLLELTNDEQKRRWLPGFTSGDLIAAIAMTEPGAGSDLRGIRATIRRDGDEYVLNGSKTFITNGISADLVIVAALADDADGRLSLIAVEAGRPGFEKSRKLSKVGHRAQDTGELFFGDVRVPSANLIGAPGEGLELLKRNLPQERLSIAVMAVAAAETALRITFDYCRERVAFGQPIGSHQANRFTLAEMQADLWQARAYIDVCIAAHVDGQLTAVEAAAAKLTTSEMQFRVLDRCLQLHGGYGYMDEYPISRLWRDGRGQRIYGGTSEIMKEIIGRAEGF